jgi:peptidoglycan/LPS O-acetylase OafA/YrhL
MSQRFSFESVAGHSSNYRADVDGLRAIAVSAVVLYHLGVRAFPYGYIGVDVFYVISGYLITSLIARDLGQGKFSIISFYDRRVRRIFPALFVVLLFCCLAAAILFIPSEMLPFGKALLSTSLFASNLYFWHSATPLGYFDTGISKQPLLHTWSLAVEEQFYVLFPLLFALMFRWAKKLTPALLLLIAIGSFALNLWMTWRKPIAAFYWSPPRAWELLIGALLALNCLPVLRNRIVRELAALAGFFMILGAVCCPLHDLPFPGVFVLLPCIGTWLVIFAGAGDSSIVGRFLSLRPVTFIGVISYSLYLWHWPIIVFSKHLPFRLTENAEIFTALLLSVLLAFLSFEFVERPFRGSGSRFSQRHIFTFGCLATMAALIVATLIVHSQGLPERYSSHTQQLIAANVERMDDLDTSCANWGIPIRTFDDIKFCNLGPESTHKILLFGDSYVEQLYPLARQLFDARELLGHGVVTAFDPGCLPDPHLNYVFKPGYHCDSFARFTLLRAQQNDVDVVFIGFSNWWTRMDDQFCVTNGETCQGLLSREALRSRFFADLADEIRSLQLLGKRVIVTLPFPEYEDSIPELDISNAIFGSWGLAESPREIDLRLLRGEVQDFASRAGVETFDPRVALCPRDLCISSTNGVSIYKDDGHLAGKGVPILATSLQETFRRALARN